MNTTYDEALEFWNQAFEMTEEDLEEYKKELNPENGWKDLASSEKLANVLINELRLRTHEGGFIYYNYFIRKTLVHLFRQLLSHWI